MRDLPHVALLIETSRSYGRNIISGVIQYLDEHRPWSVYIQPHGLESPPPRWLKNWKGDGILARVNDRRMADAIAATGLPVIDLRFAVRDLGFPSVGIDNSLVAKLAFEHLLNNGFEQFAFCGPHCSEVRGINLRRKYFQQLVKGSGFQCHTLSLADHGSPTWEKEQTLIAKWVKQLPKPIGLMASDDSLGQRVLDACWRVGVLVPEEVAVIGVDNDELFCRISNPTLSSVDTNTQQVGYEAALLLGHMMDGKRAPIEPLLLMPRGVITRESTNVLATQDCELARAIRYIRQHACEGLRVTELLRAIDIPRRSLERRLHKLLHRSPKEEIQRVQLERAKQLLISTNLTAADIAQKCGFREARYFSRVFHAKVGLPPGEFRKKTSST